MIIDGFHGYNVGAMKCPHCLVEFHDHPQSTDFGRDADAAWRIVKLSCPSCKRFVFELLNGAPMSGPDGRVYLSSIWNTYLVWPRGIARGPIPPEVPPEVAEDYKEASLVLADSPKASAALSRRCLQTLLRTAAGVKPGDLSSEIQQVLDSGTLPSTVAENIDAIRNIGNFAAHPNKSKITGEVLPVGPDEAEWNLDVLESLFDVYFVQPARARAKRDALNKKLVDAGKSPLK